MATCDVCGNDYHLAFEVVAQGQRYTFDCFECATHKLAPTCSQCGVRVLGHGMEGDGRFFCCANCARRAGVKNVADQAD